MIFFFNFLCFALQHNRLQRHKVRSSQPIRMKESKRGHLCQPIRSPGGVVSVLCRPIGELCAVGNGVRISWLQNSSNGKMCVRATRSYTRHWLLHNFWDTSAWSWCQCISGLPTYWRAPWCDPCSVDKVWFWWEIKMVEKERRALQYSVWNTIQLELPFWRDLFWVLIILGWHLMQGIIYSWYLLKTVLTGRLWQSLF